MLREAPFGKNHSLCARRENQRGGLKATPFWWITSRNSRVRQQALNEAVNNALIHGKGASDEKVRLSIRDGGDRISAHVKSCGGNFRHDMIADGSVFDDKTRESGRGVQIILHVVDGCKLTKSGGLVSMFMRKGGDEPEVGCIE